MSGGEMAAIKTVQNFEIVEVLTEKHRDAFLSVPHLIYADDPTWVPPLDLMEKRRLSPRHNPFFMVGEAALFVAMKDGRAVGRISAQVNRAYLDIHKDATGHFGFFECIDDQDVAGALVEAASKWLRRKACRRMVGPVNFTINDESGLLVEGFETDPAVFMTQSRPWMGPLLERAGLVKEMDLLAYRMKPTDAGEDFRKLAQFARKSGRIELRPADMSHYHREVALLVDIFNDAWSENWGFVPTSSKEMDMVIGEMRYFFRGNFARFLLLDGEPVGVAIVLPNYNELVKPFGGKLAPFNWAKLVWKLWRQDVHTARFTLLGIRKSVKGGGMRARMLAMLIDAYLQVGDNLKLDWVEFSWILESNKPMRHFAEAAAGPPVKRYRMFARDL
jgi:hypothetical protein